MGKKVKEVKKTNKQTKKNILAERGLILRPLGYGPSTLPPRHSANDEKKRSIAHIRAKNVVTTVYFWIRGRNDRKCLEKTNKKRPTNGARQI